MKPLLSLSLLLVLVTPAAAQPKVAIIGYKGTTPDQFAVVAMESLTSTDVIRFTDEEYDCANDQFVSATEFILTWTPPASGLDQGDVVVFKETALNTITPICTDGSGAVCGTVTLTNLFAMSATFLDHVYAYEDTDTDPSNGVTTIHSVFYYNVSALGPQDIPANENPTCDYPSAIVVDGLSPIAVGGALRIEFTPGLRSGVVNQADLENPSSYDIMLTSTDNSDLSTTLFTSVPVELLGFSIE